jgi:hypothetical protein
MSLCQNLTQPFMQPLEPPLQRLAVKHELPWLVEKLHHYQEL